MPLSRRSGWLKAGANLAFTENAEGAHSSHFLLHQWERSMGKAQRTACPIWANSISHHSVISSHPSEALKIFVYQFRFTSAVFGFLQRQDFNLRDQVIWSLIVICGNKRLPKGVTSLVINYKTHKPQRSTSTFFEDLLCFLIKFASRLIKSLSRPIDICQSSNQLNFATGHWLLILHNARLAEGNPLYATFKSCRVGIF